jgi:ubiquinone/menaquinone biosynthesis C-methylase UbiE
MKPYLKITEKHIKFMKKRYNSIFTKQKIKNRLQSRILNIGCGQGLETMAFALIAKEGKVYGIDPSKEMLKDARKNKKIFLPNSNNIKYFLGDGVNIPFTKNSQFDIITYINSFHFIPLKERILSLRKTHFLLKKNGLLIFNFPIFKKNISKDNLIINAVIKLIKKFYENQVIYYKEIMFQKESRNIIGNIILFIKKIN